MTFLVWTFCAKTFDPPVKQTNEIQIVALLKARNKPYAISAVFLETNS